MENENKSFANILNFFSEIMIVENVVCDHDFTKDIKVLFWFSIIVFNMMKLLAILHAKAGKTVVRVV